MDKKVKLIHMLDSNIQELEVILLAKKSDNNDFDILNKISLYEEEMKEFK